MKMIVIPAQLRIHVADDTTEDQINALVRNASSECCPTLLVQDQLETHLMDVAPAEDIDQINGVGIEEADVWVYGDADVEVIDRG